VARCKQILDLSLQIFVAGRHILVNEEASDLWIFIWELQVSLYTYSRGRHLALELAVVSVVAA